jgi:hypothetical protein
MSLSLSYIPELLLCAAASSATATNRWQELLLLLPDLASLLPSLHPKTLALLGSDTQGVAQKLVRDLQRAWSTALPPS